MQVLIIKTSSLGDVLHTLPALSDAANAIPGIRFDWLVEEAFAEIPGWHPAVDKVIPVAVRRWRKQPLLALAGGQLQRFRHNLRAREYDLVIDAQGLLKSALLGTLARGARSGLNRASAREPWAALTYQQRYPVAKQQHAIERVRQLFAAALGYALPQTALDYGISNARFGTSIMAANSLLFLHGTTWPSKQWPLAYWIELAQLADAAGYNVALPWGNTGEYDVAKAIASASPNAALLPKMNLSQLAATLRAARGVIGIDTGLAHLAAALSVPTVTLYGATNADLTGTRGQAQVHLLADFPCSPCLTRQCRYPGVAAVKPACFATLPPTVIWAAALQLFNQANVL